MSPSICSEINDWYSRQFIFLRLTPSSQKLKYFDAESFNCDAASFYKFLRYLRFPPSLVSRAPSAFTQGMGTSHHQLTESHTSLVKLGLGISNGTSQDSRDFIMFVPLDIVKDEDRTVPGGQAANGSFQIDPVDGSRQVEVYILQITRWRRVFAPLDCLIDGHLIRNLLSQMHQNDVHRQAVEPCAKGRLTPKGGDFPVQLHEGFLGQILRLRSRTGHAKTERIHSLLVHEVERFERTTVPFLSQSNRLLLFRVRCCRFVLFIQA